MYSIKSTRYRDSFRLLAHKLKKKKKNSISFHNNNKIKKIFSWGGDGVGLSFLALSTVAFLTTDIASYYFKILWVFTMSLLL